MKQFTLIATAIILSSSILSVAKASSPFDVPTATVKFGDLDLNRPAGQAELYRRLNRAAHAVCSPLEGALASRGVVTPQFNACLDQALSVAIARINRPEFTDYVASRTHKPAGADARLAAR